MNSESIRILRAFVADAVNAQHAADRARELLELAVNGSAEMVDRRRNPARPAGQSPLPDLSDLSEWIRDDHVDDIVDRLIDLIES